MKQLFYNEKEISQITGLSVKRLQLDRHRRQGLPYHKLGRSIRYKLDEVLERLDMNKIEPSFCG